MRATRLVTLGLLPMTASESPTVHTGPTSAVRLATWAGHCSMPSAPLRRPTRSA